MNEADYTRATYDLTTAIAKPLLALNPDLAFCFISGGGTDATEKGRVIWARVKGRAENALLGMPFRAVHTFRLAGLIPVKGSRSSTRAYRIMLPVMLPLMHVVKLFAPGLVLTARILGTAMIRGAKGELTQERLESRDIYAAGRDAT